MVPSSSNQTLCAGRKPTNEAMWFRFDHWPLMNFCEVPVLPATEIPGILAPLPVPWQTTSVIIDVIVAADGVRVRRLADLAAALEKKGVGGKVKLTLVRDGRRIDVDVDVADSATLQPG